ncbi:MAG: hypothetical protein ACK56F_09675, partial [bacterium]
MALGHCPLHRSHRHLKQHSPEGSHEPPSAASNLGDRHRPDHDVQQHPHDAYQEQHDQRHRRCGP